MPTGNWKVKINEKRGIPNVIQPMEGFFAIAGFVLSLMGAATFVTSPLQLMALILCLASEKADRFLKLRRIGLVLSAVFLILSLAFWIVVALNFDTLSQLIYSSSEYFNEFYY